MLLETEKESVCINQLVGQKKEEIIAEGDVIVNDIKPDVLSIISTSGIPCVYKKEIMEGKIKLDGSINTYIIYLADSDEARTRSLNTVIDFTGTIGIENCNLNMNSRECIKIKKIEAKVLNGRKINVKVTLEVEIEVYSNDNIELITSINNLDDMQIKECKKTVNSLLGEGETRVNAKDTISIDEADDLAEIMKVRIKLLDKDIKISYNKVLAKADAEVSILYLTEDNRIKNVSARIPIMGFVDIENINENNICDIDYTIQNCIIKPNNNQDIHSIYIEIEMGIKCSAYEEKSIDLIEDLYSISEELSFTQKGIIAMSNKKSISDICKINDTISVPEIGNNTLWSVQITPIMQKETVRNGRILFEGDINLEFLYGVMEGVDKKNVQIPFNFEILSDEIDKNCNISSNIDVIRDDFIVNTGNIDANIELKFNVSSSKNENLNVIDQITTEENKDNKLYSMVIYFVRPGDTMWKIAKKFKSTVEDIARINGIEDENKIKVGQQLYIPKFIKSKIAV